MTVAELVKELGEWPAYSSVEIEVRERPDDIGGFCFPIREIGGAAGSRIDGSDSCVTITCIVGRRYDRR